MAFKTTRSSRRLINRRPEGQQEATPFFSKSSAGAQAQSGQAFFQPKLTIGQPNDKYEQEADAVADSVVNKSNQQPAIQQKEISSIQRTTLSTPVEDEKLGTAEERMKKDKLIQEKPEIQKMEGEEEEELQMKSDGSSANTASTQVSQKINNKAGNGQKLAPKVKAEMESGFGTDFSQVNVHTDTDAVQMNKELGAQAFTHGNDVFFNTGKYNTESANGKRLLAHELTHVVQQGGGITKGILQQKNLGIQKEEITPPNKFVVANKETKSKVSDAIVGDLKTVVDKVKALTGQNIGIGFGDTTRGIASTTTKVGADNFSWHKTGRAIDFNQGLKWVIVEDTNNKSTYFKLYLVKTSTDESGYDTTFVKENKTPFHHNPYGDSVYKKTFIDVTSILEANDFTRIKAHEGWKKSYNKREWWHYEKRDSLNMYNALRQIYTEKEVISSYKKLADTKGIKRMHREGFPIDVLKKMTELDVDQVLGIKKCGAKCVNDNP